MRSSDETLRRRLASFNGVAHTLTLLLEPASPVVDGNCQVDRCICCPVADNFVLDQEILLIEPRKALLQDSQAWKSMLSNWRLVLAAMPDRLDLEAPFAFMQEYMSVTRSTSPPQRPTAQ